MEPTPGSAETLLRPRPPDADPQAPGCARLVDRAGGRTLLVTEETITSWIRRANEEGEHALVQIKEPVNKLPAYLADLVRSLELLCPILGKVRIARMLARARLQLGAAKVGRMLRAKPTRGEGAVEAAIVKKRRVTARYPNGVWHVDRTAVPTLAGSGIPWMPHARP